MTGRQFCRRWGLYPLSLEMGEICLMLIMLQPAMPYIWWKQKKISPVNHMVLPVDAKCACPVDHQYQYPLGHHPVWVNISTFEFVYDFYMYFPCQTEPLGIPLSYIHRCHTFLSQMVNFILGCAEERI